MTTGNGSYRPLTPRQAEVLIWIQCYAAEFGMPPTFRELADCLRIKSVNGLKGQLWALRKKGWLAWDDGHGRTLRLLRHFYPVAELRGGELVATGQWLAVEVKREG